jgi:hypothetical protein
MKAGRPPLEFDQEIADRICEGIADGKSLRSIVRDDETLPARSTIFKWLASNKSFADQYAKARESQADVLFEEILDIADESHTTEKMIGQGDDAEVAIVYDSVAVQRNRLRVDARKWMAGKLRPKKYGEKLELSGDPENPIKTESTINVEGLSTQALMELVALRDAANKD